MRRRKPSGRPEGYAMFAVRGANEDPAGDRAFSHVFREGAADSRFGAREQYSFATPKRGCRLVSQGGRVGARKGKGETGEARRWLMLTRSISRGSPAYCTPRES